MATLSTGEIVAADGEAPPSLRRRIRIALLLAVCAAIVTAVIFRDAIWTVVMTKRVWIDGQAADGQATRGFRVEGRWGQELETYPCMMWYPNGIQERDEVKYQFGQGQFRGTYWDSTGTLVKQVEFLHRGSDFLYRKAPPWLWGFEDQQGSSMPEWMKDDARWQRAVARRN